MVNSVFWRCFATEFGYLTCPKLSLYLGQISQKYAIFATKLLLILPESADFDVFTQQSGAKPHPLK